jgi:hypothetical protein
LLYCLNVKINTRAAVFHNFVLGRAVSRLPSRELKQHSIQLLPLESSHPLTEDVLPPRIGCQNARRQLDISIVRGSFLVFEVQHPAVAGLKERDRADPRRPAAP